MAYILALGSAALYGAADFLGGIASRRASTIAIVVTSQVAGLALLLFMLPLLPDTTPSTRDLLWGSAAGLTGGVGVALLYQALAVGAMAVVAPTTAVSAVLIPVVADMALGERVTPLTMLGIALAIVAIVLVSQQQTRTSAESRAGAWPPGMGLALASGVAIGFFFLVLARTGDEAGMWPLVAARAVSVVFFGVVALVTSQPLRLARPVASLAVACGALDILANALYLLATRRGLLSVVVTLSSLYPASTVLLARFVVGEQLNGRQVAGVVCALVAVGLIVSTS